MANITYRVNSNPAIPGTSIVKGTPLTNVEVDANFRAIDIEVDQLNSSTVRLTGDQTIAGVKTFSQPIVGAIHRLRFTDVNRNVSVPPVEIPSLAVTAEFKNNAAVGNPPVSAVPTHHSHIINVAGWAAEASGGWPTQISVSGSGLAVRQGVTATTWGSWLEMLHRGNGVALSGDQTIAGVKTFSSQIVGTTNSQVSLTGDQTIAGVKTFSAFPVLPRTLGGFYKADPHLPAFVKTGGATLSIRAQTRVEIAGAWVEFLADTAVSMPALVAGTDYAIWCSPAGALQANADPFNAPATPSVAGARRIGGFHFGLVAPGTTPAGGSFATTGFTNQGGSMIWTQAAVDRIAGINEFSIWDLAWRCKGQQRGMVLDPQTEVWHAIYFCSTNHILNGISRFNTDVASGTVLPRIPIAYGGDGTLNYGRLSQYECEEIAASFGLRLPNVDEFRSAMFGVTEAQSLGGAVATIPLTARQPGYTSRLGIEQATGHQWIFARGNSAAGGSAWIAGPNRGDAHGNLWTVLLGGSRFFAAFSGSRASLSGDVAWSSGWAVAFRAAGDLLKHV